MKKKENEYHPKEMIRDFISMQKFLPPFLDLGKDYNDLIELYISLDLDDDNTDYPTIKELQKKLGISYSVLRRKISQLYKDLSTHQYLGIDFSIKRVEYVFYLEYFDSRAYITINDLPIVPRVGEGIRFPFFKAMVGTDFFYVRKVDHEFDDTKQSIKIKLGSGDYNLFWHMKKDEEYGKGHISWDDYYHSSNDYKLKDNLGIRRW